MASLPCRDLLAQTRNSFFAANYGFGLEMGIQTLVGREHLIFTQRTSQIRCPLALREPASVLLNHSVRSRQHIRRNRQADLLGSLLIDHELEFRGLFDRNVGWLGAFQNLVNVSGSAAVMVGIVGGI